MQNEKSSVPKGKAKLGQLDLSAVDLRVGIILHARKHENAETLYVESIDVGEAEPRQVITLLNAFCGVSYCCNRIQQEQVHTF